jgi:hypothetical protein
MIKILVAGDFCPHNRIEKLVLANKFDQIYNDLLPDLVNNDINIANLECPLINEESPILKIGPTLIAREECIKALGRGNFNLLTLSNNHIMDQGVKGLNSTAGLCESNCIEIVGVGGNLEEASKVLFKKIRNITFAFLNFSEKEFSTAGIDKAGSNPLNPVKNFYSIKNARENADHVIIFIHGGHEEYPLPSSRMIETYRFFIDAGADIIIGTHTHCYSGYEKYKNGLIFYSLGNFIFDWENMRNSDWNFGYCVKLFFNDTGTSFEIIPFKQCDENPGVFLLNSAEKVVFEKNLLRLNEIISNDNLLLCEWERWVQKRRDYYLINFECLSSGIYNALRHRKLIPSFLSKRKKLKLLNLLECDSHRDLAIESLKLKNDL